MKPSVYLKGKDREAFARAVGIKPQYLDNLCSRGYKCGLKTALRIVKASGGQITLDDLLPKKDVKLYREVCNILGPAIQS